MDLQTRKRLLREYMATPRVSGFERAMAYRFREDIAPYVDEARIDRVGNVIATLRGTDPAAPSVMVFAHMDTIGYIISSIDERGFIHVERMGGVPEKTVAASAVQVFAEDGRGYPGVVAAKSYHVQTPEEKQKADTLSKMYIDIGARSRQEVRALGIEVGCPVCYAPAFYELQNDRISGSYLDDATGLVNMLEAASALHADRPQATVHFVGTVWEEFNARGAMLAARSVKADLALCLLSPGAGDTPDLLGTNNIALEDGPCMTLFNFHGKGTLNGIVAHQGMVQTMKEAAARAGVGLQRCAMRGALSDSAYIQLEDMGIPCLDMGTPDRYSHSPLETLSLRDHEATGRLLIEFLRGLNASFSTDRY